MRHSTLAGAIPLLLLLATGHAAAHGFLERADPRVGNKVAAPPREVVLWFSQKLASMPKDVPRESVPPTCAKSHPLGASSQVDRHARQQEV